MGELMESALVQIFIKVQDPRIDRRKKYSLLEILIVTIASVMCGAETWNDVEDYGCSLLDRLRQMGLKLESVPLSKNCETCSASGWN